MPRRDQNKKYLENLRERAKIKTSIVLSWGEIINLARFLKRRGMFLERHLNRGVTPTAIATHILRYAAFLGDGLSNFPEALSDDEVYELFKDTPDIEEDLESLGASYATPVKLLKLKKEPVETSSTPWHIPINERRRIHTIAQINRLTDLGDLLKNKSPFWRLAIVHCYREVKKVEPVLVEQFYQDFKEHSEQTGDVPTDLLQLDFFYTPQEEETSIKVQAHMALLRLKEEALERINFKPSIPPLEES